MHSELEKNLRQIRAEIATAALQAGRSPGEITLIGVTKTVEPERIAKVIRLGLTDLGENRVQEAIPKMDMLKSSSVQWHFIGTLQTNKVKYILPRVRLIHSLDRFTLAEELSSRAARLQIQANCLVEVNVAGESSKSGLALEEVPEFIQSVTSQYPNVAISGLMTVAPYADNPEDVRCYFRQLRQMFNRLREPYGLRHLSMGMSNDFRVAIAEGATMVRIGTAIFGRR